MNNEVDPSAEATLLAYYTFNQGIASGTNTGLITLIDQKGANNGILTNMALSGSSPNFVAQNTNLMVLPLQWLSFTAQIQNEKVLLNWSTANEQNTKDFVIQYSRNGLTWDNLAIVPAAGNNNATRYYSYVHSSPVKGMNYYRIQQKDIDGRGSFSDTRSVKFSTNDLSFIILNNPVTNGILQLKMNIPVILSIYNSTGRLLWQKKAGMRTETIDVSKYARGIYLLKTNNESKKILIQRSLNQVFYFLFLFIFIQ
jgi:Secretion system C-terminal sorting domain